MQSKSRKEDSEWSPANTAKRIGLYLICLILIACGFLILTETDGWFIALPIIALSGYYIYVDLRTLTLKRRPASKENLQRSVQLQNGVITATGDDGPDVRIVLDNVQLIGEFTEKGGLIGEWSLIFFYNEEEGAVISMYLSGAEELIEELSNYLQVAIVPALSDEFQNKSRVLWPEQLAGNPIWDPKIKLSVDGGVTLIDQVQAHLARKS